MSESPPSDSSNSPPSPPSDSSNSPPSDSSSSSTPPPSDSSSSPSPPSDSNSNSSPPPPPPPSDQNSNPPPSNQNNNSPPSNQNTNSPPSNGNNNNNNNNNDNNRSSSSPPRAQSPPLWTPPPSRSAGSPPLPNRPSPASSNDDSSSSNNSGGIAAGAVIGAGLLILIFIVILVSCCRRKKRRKPHDQMKYYRDSRGHRNSDYYNSGGLDWQNAPPKDHMMKIPPQQGGGAGVNADQNCSAPPPPMPPRMSSSELSSGYSGGIPMPPPHPAMALGFNQSTFTYDELAAATGDFTKSNLLGQGGFGYVHKGVLPNGKEIAVKSLKANSGQGEREFQAEVDIISRVHHRHLVSLVGYCISGTKRLLVYEFVPNGTLEYHLHGADCPPMDWPTRLKIALGSAKGFAYLHEDCHPRIIHRDIKAANILLESNYEAKVADFGLAKLSEDTNTHVSTRIMGTFGYLAPEYASSGKLTEKSDVYSFGIMLLELITGRRPIDIHSDDDGLVDWARPILIQFTEGGSYEELVDPRLENNYDPQEMVRMIASAAACIRHSAKRRPKMSKIVRALEGDVSLDDLNEGTKPGHSRLLSSASEVDLTRFRKTALSSQEFSSSEHGSTGEYARSNGANSPELIKPNPGSHYPDV